MSGILLKVFSPFTFRHRVAFGTVKDFPAFVPEHMYKMIICPLFKLVLFDTSQLTSVFVSKSIILQYSQIFQKVLMVPYPPYAAYK